MWRKCDEPGVSIHAPAWGATYNYKIKARDRAFQSTLPRGERHRKFDTDGTEIRFQSTLPRGERQIISITHINKFVFQSTLPRGERRTNVNGRTNSAKFQSTLPRGERHGQAGHTRQDTQFQSTLPRGERLLICFISRVFSMVSIHAPAWGATTAVWHELTGQKVSIHAPAWGATSNARISISSFCFNPRSRVGSDALASRHSCRLQFQSTLPRGERLIGTSSLFADSQVSIHAPAWGATIPPSFIGCASLFQSTLPRGERHLHAKLGDIGFMFQSTLPRGERHLYRYKPIKDKFVSIHAPAWGATMYAYCDKSMYKFQSTLPRGERQNQTLLHP